MIEFDQAMATDATDSPGNWVFHAVQSLPFVGSALSWDDATHLRVHTSPGFPTPPRSGDYTQTGGDVMSALGAELATNIGFAVS